MQHEGRKLDQKEVADRAKRRQQDRKFERATWKGDPLSESLPGSIQKICYYAIQGNCSLENWCPFQHAGHEEEQAECEQAAMKGFHERRYRGKGFRHWVRLESTMSPARKELEREFQRKT